MDRLVKSARGLVYARRRQDTYAAHAHCRKVGEDVAEEVARDDDVELRGIAHELHGGVIHQHVFEQNVGIVGMHVVHALAPKPGGLEHVGFVYARDLSPSLLRQLEGDSRYPLHFQLAVSHDVIALGAVFSAPHALFAEIDAADELAHDEQVYLPGVFQRADLFEGGKEARGAQVRIKPHRLSHSQERAFGALFIGERVVLRTAHRAQKHAVAFQADLQALLGQRFAVSVVSRAAANAFGKVELVRKTLAHLDEHVLRRAGHFGTDAVAFDHCYVISSHISPNRYIYRS